MMCVSETPDYLVIGHVTQDRDGPAGFRAGGTATYAAATAARLGLRVGVVTSAGPSFASTPHASIELRIKPAPATTTFENTYAQGRREQHIRAVAAPLGLDDVPREWQEASIVHLGPVAQEVAPELVMAFPRALLGVTPQGWFRRWGDDAVVRIGAWESAERVLQRADVVVLSPEDVAYDQGLLDHYRRMARLLIVTMGVEGAIVYEGARAHPVPAFAVQEVDPTGAGDVFAAAYLVRFFETQDVWEAARFANCVASFAVEGLGITTIPTRDQVQERLRHGALRVR
jgi:sugar/nucleoside kinase (ribokinase family)